MSDLLALKTPTFKVKDLEMKPDPAKRVLTSKEAVKEAAQKQQDKEDKERKKKIREQKKIRKKIRGLKKTQGRSEI